MEIIIRTEFRDALGVSYYETTGSYTVEESELRTIQSDQDGAIVEFERDGETIRANCTFTHNGAIWEVWRHLPPEETLSVLAEQTSIREDTLLKAAQQGRLLTRRSGSTWLSTVAAIEAAIKSGRIRK